MRKVLKKVKSIVKLESRKHNLNRKLHKVEFNHLMMMNSPICGVREERLYAEYKEMRIELAAIKLAEATILSN